MRARKSPSHRSLFVSPGCPLSQGQLLLSLYQQMHIPDPRILKPLFLRRLKASHCQGLFGKRHVRHIKMGMKSEQTVRDIRIYRCYEACLQQEEEGRVSDRFSLLLLQNFRRSFYSYFQSGRYEDCRPMPLNQI